MKIFTHHLTIAKNPMDSEQDFLSFCKSHEIVFHSENCFSVKNTEGKYLTAFRNNSIKFHSDECNSWEKFYIIDDEAESVINFAINKLQSDYRFFLDKNRIHVLLNNTVITPSFIPPASLKKSEWFIEYETLAEKKRIQINKPLIYFCIYGKEEYYECFYLAVESLIKKGKYTGDILVKTDNIGKVKTFCDQFTNYFIYSEIDQKIGIFNRYWLHEPCLKEYSSLIYFDSDILTINDISNTLKYLQQSDLVSYIGGEPEQAKKYFYEDGKYDAYKWYGMQYINKQYTQRTNEFYILNSGLFAINDLVKLKPIMDKIVQYYYLEDKHGDQPFFNIVLYNSKINISTLNYINNLAFSRSSLQSFRNLDKVLIHYNSGVGNVSKLNLMKETWDHINSFN